MKDELSRIEELRREAESEMDIDAIWEDEYKAVMAREIYQETKDEARRQAEADILRLRNVKKRVSD
jgi:hypothetical protein